jgi:hypothetical protein
MIDNFPIMQVKPKRIIAAVVSGEVSRQSEGGTLYHAFLCSHGGIECQVFTVISTNRPRRAWFTG